MDKILQTHYPFIMLNIILYKVILAFEFVDEILMTILMKAIEQYIKCSLLFCFNFCLLDWVFFVLFVFQEKNLIFKRCQILTKEFFGRVKGY